MNKLKVGPPAVSRYHQISRFFPSDDKSNVPDHDFPNPGYLLIPSGYMQLIEPATDTGTVQPSKRAKLFTFQIFSFFSL